jgi:hypothetical protein
LSDEPKGLRVQSIDITAERLGELIGFTATSTVCVWFGGRALFIPNEPTQAAPLQTLLGEPAVRRLCVMFGGDRLVIPILRNAQMRPLRGRVAVVQCSGQVARNRPEEIASAAAFPAFFRK